MALIQSGIPSGSSRPVALAATFTAGGLVGARLAQTAQFRFANMSGSSIAEPSAAGWVTDFLNAAYYARARQERDVDDLRLAFCILTTRWHRQDHRRLGVRDLVAFHRAFGQARFLDATHSTRFTLNRDQLLSGAARMFGDWFPAAYADDARRGWGIAFESTGERAAFDPEVRLRRAKLGRRTPPVAPGPEQIWHTYAPVPVVDVDAVLAGVTRPETWPDYASEIGRFTPVRPGGLDGQTFEIEVMGEPLRRVPLFVRAYVTVTRLVTTADPAALDAWVGELNDSLLRLGRDEPPAVPAGAEALAGFDLTTHEGHFMGSARNRIVVFRDERGAYLRAAGTWDPLRWDLSELYQRMGRWAQHAMWGMEQPEQSMLHQLALRCGGVRAADELAA